MSTYYYFRARGTKEYFELTSASWWSYLENLSDILNAKVRAKKSYKDFVDTLRKKKTFEDFYDDGGEFITPENEKYFLRPLYDWAYKCGCASKEYYPIELIADDELYELAIQGLCKEKGIPYSKGTWQGHSPEIQKALTEYDKEHRKEYWDGSQWAKGNGSEDDEGMVDHYLTCVGKMFYDEEVENNIGVNFEHAFSELKQGATIRRKSKPYNFYYLYTDKSGNQVVGGSCDGKLNYFNVDDMMAEDWEYDYKKAVTEEG